MSEADKFFEKIKYIKLEKNNENYIGYVSKDTIDFILFILDKKMVCPHKYNTKYTGISMEELKAIQMKCDELGWK